MSTTPPTADTEIDLQWAADCERAERLWPNDKRNQIAWLNAMAVVRKTQRGWLLDTHIPRLESTVLA